MSLLTTLLAPIPLGSFEPPTEAYSSGSESPETATANLELFVSNSLGFLTVLGALFFIVYFFMAAFRWITAGGDSGKVGKARDQMMQGVLGLIVMVAAYGIIGLVGSIIGLDLLNPGQQVLNIYESLQP